MNKRDPRRGSALLAVLWLSIALTAIAFALSRGVRAEFDRASLNIDSTRAYYLARGGVEAAVQRMARRGRADDPSQGFLPGQSYFFFQFPSGRVEVEIVGESGKLNVNNASPEAMSRLLGAMGVDPGAASGLAAGIVAYRTQRRGQGRDQVAPPPSGNRADSSTFSSSSASIEELEELLVVPGMTPDLLYGAWRNDPQGRLRRIGGLYANLTTEGSGGAVDLNYASAEMLAAAGLDRSRIEQVITQRRAGPIPRDSGLFNAGGSGTDGIQLGASSSSLAYTVIATARTADDRATRSVAARVRIGGEGPDPVRIVRWYDTIF